MQLNFHLFFILCRFNPVYLNPSSFNGNFSYSSGELALCMSFQSIATSAIRHIHLIPGCVTKEFGEGVIPTVTHRSCKILLH